MDRSKNLPIEFNNREEALDWLNSLNTFNDNGSLKSGASLRLRKNDVMRNSLKKIVEIDSDNPSELIYNLLNPNCNRSCEVCGTPVKFYEFTLGYHKACCREHADILSSQKGIETKNERYSQKELNAFAQKAADKRRENNGGDYSESIRKAKATSLERYGNENFNNSEKCKQTKLERYGDPSYYNVEKQEKTNLEKYGVRAVMQNEEVKEHYKANFRENHGVDWPMQSPEIYESRMVSYTGTKPEIVVKEYLERNNITFESNKQINGKNFDFLIYDGCGNLTMIIDVDGTYYHGISADYNGFGVNGSKDIFRFKKCPDGVKLLIMDGDDSKISRSVNCIKDYLVMSYDDWIDEMYSLLPEDFPYPSYSDYRLKKTLEYAKGSEFNKNQALGISIIKQFHKSIWRAGKEKSPVEIWKDKEKLKEIIRRKELYLSRYSSKELSEFFNGVDSAYVPDIVNPTLIREILKMHCGDDLIFNPNNRYSEVLLGSAILNRNYIGLEKDDERYEEALELIKYFNFSSQCVIKDVDGFDIRNSILVAVAENDCEIDKYLNLYDCRKYVFICNDSEKYQKILPVDNRRIYNLKSWYIVIKEKDPR